MQGFLPILTLFLAPFSLSIPINSFICPGFMFIQQALPKNGCKEIIPYEPDYTFLKQKKVGDDSKALPRNHPPPQMSLIK